MLNSTILDVVIALIFVFLTVSLAAGAMTEALASLIKLRSTTPKSGVMDLLNDQNFNDLAAELYAHALISPRAPGLTGVHDLAPAQNPPPAAVPPAAAPPAAAPPVAAPPVAVPPVATVRTTMAAQGPAADTARDRLVKNLKSNLPAYIEPKQFAAALTDVLSLVPRPGSVPTVAELQQAVNTRLLPAKYPQINQLLNGIILRADGDLTEIRKDIAGWFDNAMDRLSGVYKRYTQVIAFIAALLIAFILNADALQVARRVWAQPALVQGIKAGTTEQTTSAWQLAQTLPIGWAEQGLGYVRNQSGDAVWLSGTPLILAALGWLITAFASLFGAPFWFDALQQITRLKGAGPSPDEKADKTSASA